MNEEINRISTLFAQQNFHDVPMSRLYEMSAKERDEVRSAVHGVYNHPEETEAFLAQKQWNFDSELQRYVKSVSSSAFQEAYQRHPTYVNSLKLCFLRTEQYREVAAVQRMVKHFEMRRELFPESPDILGRHVQLSDLSNDEDQRAFREGALQLLKERDRVGRPILFMHPFPKGNNAKPFAFQSLKRLFFWFLSTASQFGKDVQQKGVVFIWWGIVYPRVNPVQQWMMQGRFPAYTRVSRACAGFISSIHAVTDDSPQMKPLFEEVKDAPSDALLRFHSHLGTALKCRTNLQIFGILPESLPLSPLTGEVDMMSRYASINHQHLLQWLQSQQQQHQQQQQQEQQGEEDESEIESLPFQINPTIPLTTTTTTMTTSTTTTIHPQPNDIILGRGKRGIKHPGNCRLRTLIEARYDEYQHMTSLSGKRLIAMEIYNILTDNDGGGNSSSSSSNGRSTTHRTRFLTLKSMEVDDSTSLVTSENGHDNDNDHDNVPKDKDRDNDADNYCTLMTPQCKYWVEVDVLTAVARIRHGFRNYHGKVMKERQKKNETKLNSK